MTVIYANTLAEPEPEAYRQERFSATVRASQMSDAELDTELMRGADLSVLTYNIYFAARAARRTRLPDEPSAHVHLTDYDPWESR